MALNINEVEKNKKRMRTEDRPLVPADNHLGILVKVVDLGLQPRPPFKGEEKDPCYQMELTFEFPDVKMEYKGEEAPMHLSRRVNISSFSESNCMKFYNALDPSGEVEGDFSKLVGRAALVQVVHDAGQGKHAGRTFDKIAMVSTLPSVMAKMVPELSTEPLVFDMSNPDLAQWDRLPEWLQTRIKSALNFEGSRLEKKLRTRESGETPEPTATAPMEDGIPNAENVPADSNEFDDDIPW